MRLIKKNFSIFYAKKKNWNAAGKCSKSIGYMDTVLFLTISKPDTVSISIKV
jgi:hypothetical protein